MKNFTPQISNSASAASPPKTPLVWGKPSARRTAASLRSIIFLPPELRGWHRLTFLYVDPSQESLVAGQIARRIDRELRPAGRRSRSRQRDAVGDLLFAAPDIPPPAQFAA